jgi:spermidine synthase
VLVWVTSYDAALIGSNDPIVIDEAELARRMAVPVIRDDLAPLHMSTAEELLSLFVMGTAGARAFAQDGEVNTDDNLVLEFSAPASQGVVGLDAENVRALARHRESLLPYLRTPASEAEAALQRERWSRHLETGRMFDEAHARFILGDPSSPEVDALLALVEAAHPGYAPVRFLRDEQEFSSRMKPAVVDEAAFAVRDLRGAPGAVRVAAVRQFVGRERVLLSFMDPGRRRLYAQRFVDGDYQRLEGEVAAHVATTLAAVRDAAASLAVRSRGVPEEPELERVVHEVLGQGMTAVTR